MTVSLSSVLPCPRFSDGGGASPEAQGAKTCQVFFLPQKVTVTSEPQTSRTRTVRSTPSVLRTPPPIVKAQERQLGEDLMLLHKNKKFSPPPVCTLTGGGASPEAQGAKTSQVSSPHPKVTVISEVTVSLSSVLPCPRSWTGEVPRQRRRGQKTLLNVSVNTSKCLPQDF